MQPKIFISSRLQGLEEEREVVKEAVSELWNNENLPFRVWSWESAKEIPSGKHPDEVQSKGVRESNMYVLIIGSEYGDFEYGESPTHKEYDIACSELEKDCILIYIRKGGRIEEKLEKWIEELKNKHALKPFENPDQLKNLVKTRLRDLWREEKWKANKVDADGKLPDIRVEVKPATVLDWQKRRIHLLILEAQNHDKTSVFLGLPSIAIKNSRNRVTISRDPVTHLPVPTGELKLGDSRSVHFDPTPVEMEDIEQWGEVIFCDKIGREFKGSAAATSEAIQFWKALVGL